MHKTAISLLNALTYKYVFSGLVCLRFVFTVVWVYANGPIRHAEEMTE